MKINKSYTTAVASAAAGLLALIVAPNPSFAQGPGGPPAIGSITAIDASGKTITVTNDQSGDATTVSVASSTNILTQATSSVGSLKVGDTVRIQGAPTGITADSIVEGAIPGRPGGGGPGGPGGPGGGPGAGGPGGPGGGRGGGGGGPATMGTIKSLSPLVVTLPDGNSLTVATTSTTKVSTIATEAFTALKVGDRVVAIGQPGDNGNLNAATLLVNMQLGGGRGGFGGGRGGRGGGGGGGFGGGGGGGGGFGGGGAAQ